MPSISNTELAAADLSELCRLVAEARVAEKLWRDIFKSAIVEALGSKR